MHRRITMKSAGFTLLEMSIVVVIVSLLIGALAGIRSYTRNAELSNTMNEAKYFVSAFNQFQQQYNGPPGDFPTATSMWTETVDATNGNHNGDGNGLIHAGISASANERYYAFQHLALGGFIAGKYTGILNSHGGATLGVNVPAASVKGVGFIFDHPDAPDGVESGDTTYIDGMYPNVIIVAGSPDNNASTPNQGFMTPKEAMQLDQKYDDGIAGTGNITPPKNGGTCSDVDTGAAVYKTSNGDKVCYFIIKMVGT